MVQKKGLIINGPNLNLLGTREPTIYGSTSLKDVEESVARRAAEHGLSVSSFQTNHEGTIVDRIHEAWASGVDAIIINPGAFTHTSVAIRDALAGTAIPLLNCISPTCTSERHFAIIAI